MSRAAEWSKRMKEALAASQALSNERPKPIALQLAPSARITLAIDVDGKPLIKVELPNGKEEYGTSPSSLLSVAGWIRENLDETVDVGTMRITARVQDDLSLPEAGEQ